MIWIAPSEKNINQTADKTRTLCSNPNEQSVPGPKDKGLNGELYRLGLLTWIMFLRFLDEMEIQRDGETRLTGKKLKSILLISFIAWAVLVPRCSALARVDDAPPYTFVTIAGNVAHGIDLRTHDTPDLGTVAGIVADRKGNIFATQSIGIPFIAKLSPTFSMGKLEWGVGILTNRVYTNSPFFHGTAIGITATPAGKLYVVEAWGAPAVDEVQSLGDGNDWIKTTIAGGQSRGFADGTNGDAIFSYPEFIAAGRDNDLYVTDNNTIRQVAPVFAGGRTNWVVTTIAGLPASSDYADGTNGDAHFMSLGSIVADRSGALFVADSLAGTIRKVAPLVTNGRTDWVVSTIAGSVTNFGSADGINTQATFFYPAGLAFDRKGCLYVCDAGNDTIRRITPVVSDDQTNWMVTTLAGSVTNAGCEDGVNSGALFNNPFALTFNHDDQLFVFDALNEVIREITLSRSRAPTNYIVSTIAGLATRPGSADGLGPNARFFWPSGIAADAEHNVYLADTANFTIREISPLRPDIRHSAWNVITIAGSPGNFRNTDGTNSEAGFCYPSGIVTDQTGNLFVLTRTAIRQVTRSFSGGQTNWMVNTIIGGGANSGDFATDGTNQDVTFFGPNGLAIDGKGNLFVADCSTIRMAHPQPSTTGTDWVVTTIAGSLTNGVGLSNVDNVDGTNGAARFYCARSITVDQQGSLFVADPYVDTIRKITPQYSNGHTDWVTTTIAGTPGVSGFNDGTNRDALFMGPCGIKADREGNLFVADSGAIRKLTRQVSGGQTNWVTTTIAGAGPGGTGGRDGTGSEVTFSGASGIAIADDGTLFVTDQNTGQLRMGYPARRADQK